MLNYPQIFFLISLLVLWFASQAGVLLRRRAGLREEQREEFGVVQAAILTLLALIIGFMFSMAVSRYDLRKTYEEAESNAIGTEYLRVGLLPAQSAAQVHSQLKRYVQLRILFYQARNDGGLGQINADTRKLQDEMWSEVQSAAVAQAIPTAALAVAGMNEVLDSQGRTQAAWWNRIPVSAWVLVVAIAILSTAFVGYSARYAGLRSVLLAVLPLAISISFFLIADIDSPRRGFIAVTAENLVSLAQSLP